MEYRELGKTGLKVSRIGFGGIPLQRINIDITKELFQRAEDLGINFIDTAKGYTVSEEYIGYALEGRRDKWIVATKSMARSKEAMKKDIETSLEKLKTKYIDLYQIHNVRTMEDYERIFKEDGAYQALLEAKEKGEIRHIGFTTHSLDMLKKVIEDGIFETVMYPYNLVETQAAEAFAKAYEKNIGVIAMKPMAGGALEDGSLAMRFILDNPSVTTAIPGMADISEVETNAKVGNNSLPLTEEERRNASRLAEELGTEFCRRCGYCAPCAKGIDIPSVFVFKGYKDRYDLAAWAEDRYFSLKSRAKDCIECGICEKRCPYNLPIRKMMKEAKITFGE